MSTENGLYTYQSQSSFTISTQAQQPCSLAFRSRGSLPTRSQPTDSLTGNPTGGGLSERCFEIVQEYRTGKVTKTHAIIRLQCIISQENLTKEGFKQSFGTYLDMLDNFERQQSAALTFGSGATQVIRSATPARLDGSNGGKPSREQNGNRGEPEQQIDERRGNNANAKRCLFEIEHDSDLNGDETGGPSHRHRINLELCPWLIEERGVEKPLSESLEQTRLMLTNFSSDPKLVRSSIVNTASCPLFPDTEWMHIVLGKAVDFDQVLTAFSSTTYSTIHKEKIGGVEFSLPLAVPAKIVQGQGEWTTCWNEVARAYAFVFPHRLTELNNYYNHIS
ncbi:hypothetical protein EW146_g9418 [Bondarzewia mesenterica]|uniref:Uncharacterized protein n=1 Tax=Bondarzewia mesenterica TaxID=1095465 RepID=A0A4S4LBT4_9AGAM|nr:hypothetical protein EW146_g9418 [Bondarzewia mesenterica]